MVSQFGPQCRFICLFMLGSQHIRIIRPEKIMQQDYPHSGHDGFRMKLYPLDGQGFMSQPHQLTLVGVGRGL
jgi:hypothetical protein